MWVDSVENSNPGIISAVLTEPEWTGPFKVTSVQDQELVPVLNLELVLLPVPVRVLVLVCPLLPDLDLVLISGSDCTVLVLVLDSKLVLGLDEELVLICFQSEILELLLILGSCPALSVRFYSGSCSRSKLVPNLVSLVDLEFVPVLVPDLEPVPVLVLGSTAGFCSGSGCRFGAGSCSRSGGGSCSGS